MRKLLIGIVLFPFLVGCGHPVTVGLAAWLSQPGSKKDKAVPVPLQITTTSLQYAINGAAYSDTVTAAGGSLPYAWSVTANNPPAGITIDPVTGELSGTPGDLAGDFTFTVQVQDDAADTATRDLTITLYDDLRITYTPPLPDATLATPYGPVTITTTGGTGNYTWSITAGSLPSGLTLNSGNGQISGTPNDAVAAYPFTVTVQDDAVPAQLDTIDLTINLWDSLTISTTSLPYAINSVAYNATVNAGGGTLPYTWSVSAGSPPSAITIDAGTGVLSGLAGDTAQDYTFTVQVVDGAAASATKQLTITLYDELQITYTPPLPDAENGQAYGPETITVTGGTGGTTWSISAGTLPSGVTLTTTNGEISGTPTDTVAAYPITVMVQDDAVPAQTDTIDLTLNLFDTLTITTTTLPYAINGVAYNETLSATGGEGTNTWTEVGTNLPTGLNVAAAGAIQGTAADTTGLYNFTVQVDDNGNPAQSDTQGLSIDLYDQLQITSSATLPTALEGAAYSETLTASGGDGNYGWTNPTADLPGWLSLDAVTGELSSAVVGTSGLYTFTVRVTDGETPAQTHEVVFSLTVVSEITWEDLFVDSSKIAASASIEVTNGYARLSVNLGAEQWDANFDPGDTNPAHDFGNTTYIAQTFTVLTSGKLTSAVLAHIRNTGGVQLILEIRNVVIGQPGPVVLCTTGPFGTAGGWGWHGAAFSNPIDVIAGQTLALVCRGTGGTTDHSGTSDWFNPYGGGRGFVSTDSGSNWSTLDPNRDLGFGIRVEPFNTFNAPGTVESVDILPASVSEWTRVAWNAAVPALTSVTIQVLYDSGGGNWVLIPDVDLANNSTGFTTSPVDLTGLSVVTYPGIRLRATLDTSDNTITPRLLDWQVVYKP